MSNPAVPLLADAFPLAREAGDVLRARGLTVAVAESCTGGLLGAALTAVGGSSAYVRGGVIAYADDVKVAELAVDPSLLRTSGAVSEPVAREMAQGARVRMRADVGLAVTGVAGPDGGTEDKPVGLVFVAAARAGSSAVVRLEGDLGREANRARAVSEALALCIAVAREAAR